MGFVCSFSCCFGYLGFSERSALMNRRVIVNAATGKFYCNLQQRLLDSFLKSVDQITIFNREETAEWETGNKTGIDLILWRDLFPPGSRSHEESSYGFKVHGFKYAYEKGYTSVLWLDSPAYAVQKDVSPIFEKIEKEGYYAMSHLDPLINQVGDRYLNFYEMKREELEGLNLPSGSCYGFDLRNPLGSGVGYKIFESLRHDEFRGLFKVETTEEWNHRHDEAALACILKRMGLPVFLFDPLFQSESKECVIKSGKCEDD
jgi:hypothetical protein